MKKFLLVLLIICFAIPAFAMTANDTVVMSILPTACTATNSFTMFSTSSFTATTLDTGGFYDFASFVIYDGYGTVVSTVTLMAPFPGTYTNLILPFGLMLSPAARPFTMRIYDTVTSSSTIAEAETYPLLDSITFDPADFGVCDFLPVYTPPSDDSAPQFRDGRLNRFDMAAPFVVYGHEYEDGRGLVVYSPEGALLLTVGPDEVAVECTGETIELASDNGVTLYLLPSCEYQMMARSLDGTKNYVLIFSELSPNASYRSYEE